MSKAFFTERWALAAMAAAIALAACWQASRVQAAGNRGGGYAMCSDQSEWAPCESGQCELGPCDMGQCELGQCDMGACCDDAACSKCCSPWGHCTSVWGEFLFLHPTGADMVHAQQQDGIGGAGTVPFGQIGVTDPHHEPGYRVGGNLALSNCSSISLSYTFFESDSRSRVNAPIIPGGGGAVGSLVHHPGAAITASAGPVDAEYYVDFQLGDVEYRRLLFGDNYGWMNYSVGARYAHLDQEFDQAGIFAGGATGLIHTSTDVEFDGGGAMFGLDGERRFGRRGLSLYGNVGVSPIVGQFSSIYTLTNETTDQLLTEARWKDDRFVTIVDFEIGVAWTSRNKLWRVSSGYTASFWYNTVTTPTFVDAVQANNYVDIGDTLAFDGVTTRLERRF